MTTRNAIISLSALALAAVAPAASAGTINAQAFQPSPHQGSLLSLSTSRPATPLSVNAGFASHYTDSPIAFSGQATGGRQFVEQSVKTRLMGELLLGFAPWSWLDIAVAMPLVVMGEGSSVATQFTEVGDTSGFRIGEARAHVKANVLRGRKGGIALQVDTTLPTGDPNGLVSNGLGYGGRLVADYRMGPLTIALNGGVYMRAEESRITCRRDLGFAICGEVDETTGAVDDTVLAVGDELVAGLGGELQINEKLSVVAEAYTRTAMTDPFGETSSNQLEAMGAVRYRPNDWMVVSGGGGGGTPLSLMEDLNLLGYGTSKFRFFADVRFTGQLYMDSDDDGVGDGDDNCPFIPEDEDGFQDEDGCPEPDNDGDGFLDDIDQCPNDVEDADGFQDDDGCPEVDNDQDGIPDGQDQCTDDPEDPDGYQDDDGCPEHDNDGDGVDDKVDLCVFEPETINGFQDEDGCKDFPGVALVEGRFVLGQNIDFDPITQEIDPGSFQILRDFARFLNETPAWKTIRLDVHTDAQGDPSELRARTEFRVERLRRFLVAEGVRPGRLELHSIGGFKPIADSATAAGRATNNRVEIFLINP